MTIDMQPSMAQSVGTSRSSFSSSNGIEDTPLHNSAAISNGDDYDSDTSNFAPPYVSRIPLELYYDHFKDLFSLTSDSVLYGI